MHICHCQLMIRNITAAGDNLTIAKCTRSLGINKPL